MNVAGTQSLLSACAATDSVGGVVLASTGAVYEPGDRAHDEDSALGPTDVYGLTKLWAEQLIDLFRRRTQSAGAVARLFNVFGPGETNPHLIPTVISQAQTGRPLRLGNLSTRRDYVYVHDVAEAILTLADELPAADGLTCNVGGGRAIDGHEVVDAVAGVVGRDVEVQTDPARVRASDRPVLLSDCRRARARLGWQPRTSLENGLREAARRPLAAGIDV